MQILDIVEDVEWTQMQTWDKAICTQKSNDIPYTPQYT